jgi:hydrogenase expression/formation protein HypC
MCLAVPGRVLELREAGDLRAARVDFGGVVREASLAFVPDARVGDYVLVHVGFAISLIDEAAARATFETLAELGALELPEA